MSRISPSSIFPKAVLESFWCYPSLLYLLYFHTLNFVCLSLNCGYQIRLIRTWRLWTQLYLLYIAPFLQAYSPSFPSQSPEAVWGFEGRGWDHLETALLAVFLTTTSGQAACESSRKMVLMAAIFLVWTEAVSMKLDKRTSFCYRSSEVSDTPVCFLKGLCGRRHTAWCGISWRPAQKAFSLHIYWLLPVLRSRLALSNNIPVIPFSIITAL